MVKPIALVGGWGYDNLGDEAILAGYLETLDDLGVDYRVLSRFPKQTMTAQRSLSSCETEYLAFRNPKAASSALIFGGGGYLNGHWFPEAYLKLFGAARIRGGEGVIATHAVEIRQLNSRIGRKLIVDLTKNAHATHFSVRDEESRRELTQCLGSAAVVNLVPDAISLLYPYLDKYDSHPNVARGRTVLNLMDISRRADSMEADFAVADWDSFAQSLVAEFGDSALGLVMGSGDLHYMRRFRNLDLVRPKSVQELVSVLRSADQLVSVRMHPSLVASAVGTPSVAIPYCGKVRPTLASLGLEHLVLDALSLPAVHHRLEAATRVCVKDSWENAVGISRGWLESVISGVQS